jgi:hypothetical protein
MKQSKLLMLPVALSLVIVLVLARNAHAYLDPGTGSYLIQILLATLVGSAFAIKIFWHNIKGFLGRMFSKNEGESDDTE